MPAASHITRGSKQLAAAIVNTTTDAKANTPGLAVMLPRPPKCTSATRIETMKTSIIDQRPMKSISRNSRERSTSRVREPRHVHQHIELNPRIFSTGTVMLAKNTSSASGSAPVS